MNAIARQKYKEKASVFEHNFPIVYNKCLESAGASLPMHVCEKSHCSIFHEVY